MRGIDKQLFRHAAPDDAGAAIAVFLGHGHAGAMAGGDARGPYAARTGTDYKQVKVVGHKNSLKGRQDVCNIMLSGL